MMNKLSMAILIATTAHDGQFDKSGRPYILHCLKVMHYLKSEDEELNCIAVLHDVVEDTDTTLESIQRTFNRRIATAIELLSKIRPGETQEQYLEGILSNVDAMLVKRCDLRHNMDIRRLKGVTEKDIKRLDKYAKMYTAIEARLKELGHA